MTEHLTDDVLAQQAGTGPGDGSSRLPDEPRRRQHLDECTDCRTRLAVWQNVGAAMRAESAEQAVSPPSFDALLVPVLAGAGASAAAGVAARADGVGERAPVAHPRDPARSWRTAWQLTLRQAALMPRIWAPLSAAGFVGAALLASAHVQDGLGVRLFGAAVVLLVMLGALMVASPRRDPRRELLFTLPVPPAAVFLARLTVVLFADVAMAMVCSGFVDGPGWWGVVMSWLGESLLAASLALALAVRLTPAAGAAAGGVLWLLGVVGGPQGLIATPADALLNVLLSTPLALALAVALLAWAVGAMRSYGQIASSR